MDQIILGDVTVTRVREWYGPIGMGPRAFIPGLPESAWQDAAPMLSPDFLDAEADIVRSAVQTWVLRSEGKTILVDTGNGNHKERPHVPMWGHLDTDYLAVLAAAGVEPEDVDIVVNTHLHLDHVGWNTRLEDRAWVPTFPNATYLIAKDDFEYWNPANGHKTGFGPGNQNVFEDSVAPVHAAGQTLLWQGSHRLDGNLELTLAPGHTPGSSVLTLASGGDRALFAGDILHSPVQFAEPDHSSCFCEDPATARATRHRLLGWAADSNALVFPAHFGGHAAVEIARAGSSFAVKNWAPFTPYQLDGSRH
jgi:glyoxylase-like metal-dependent hydrolase (beta-lactamase superfamily II)